jgi:ankyrin repeat protein
VQALIAAKADTNAALSNGGTALLRACSHGYIEVARALLAAGAGVNVSRSDGDSALLEALASGRMELV